MTLAKKSFLQTCTASPLGDSSPTVVLAKGWVAAALQYKHALSCHLRSVDQLTRICVQLTCPLCFVG